MNKTTEFLVDKKDIGIRIDIFLSKKIENLTRSYLKKLIEKKNLIINGRVITSPSVKVKINDKIIFKTVDKIETRLVANKINIETVFEDKDILVINKPKGMVVHPGSGNFQNTLANALFYKYKNKLSNINGNLRPGIVHRIDKETSGLLVVAKNNISHSKLGEQFGQHTIKRKYQCLVWGTIRPLNGRIETLIARSNKNRQLMSVSENRGKKAITNYKTLKVFNLKDVPKISLLECELETGRTHQIRVHLSYKGSPLLGDKQYGRKKLKFKKVNKKFIEILDNIKGQVLHAQTLEFIHPTKNKWVSFSLEKPTEFKKLLKLLKNLNS